MKKEPQTPPPGVIAGVSRAPVGQQAPWTPASARTASTHTRVGSGSNNPYRAGNPNQIAAITQVPTPEYEAPPGPPPSWKPIKDEPMEDADEVFEPPPGPPPSRLHSQQQQPQYAPPPGPPPSRGGLKRKVPDHEPPEYDPWHGGPDNQLRPPPAFAAIDPKKQKSPTANASYESAQRAHAWCREVPLFKATDHDAQHLERIEAGDLRLTYPPNTADITNYQPAVGKTYIRTFTAIQDTILLSDLPVFASLHQSPLATGKPETIYFELHVINLGDRYDTSRQVESGLAIGFVAPPYPAWRLPGWHRASLGVHGDDGRRYVDNSYGGIDFTRPFKKGDTVGIGMTFNPPVHGDSVAMRARVFFTRNGRLEGGWDLHEERDIKAEEGDVTGLEGEHDLLAAVGIFGQVEFEVSFRREEWLFQP